MKQTYRVERSSIYSDEDHYPCIEAIQRSYTTVDIRVVDDPVKIKEPNAVYNWYHEGTNHRVEEGKIKRDFTEFGWFVTFKNCEELHLFIKKYKHLHIDTDYTNPDQFLITIEDGVL